MLRLLSFLSNHRNLLYFILLEVIALWIVVTYNDRQRHIFGDQMLEVTGSYYVQRNNITNFFQLGTFNDQLQRENDSLRTLIVTLQNELAVLDGLAVRDSLRNLVDSLTSKEDFAYIPTHAIQNTTHLDYNYITLDKGTSHGVKNRMGLISPQGVAGWVINVSENFSIALSVINRRFFLSAKVAGKNVEGGCIWDGENPAYASLENIPLNVELFLGERVVTSNNNAYFPADFTIGYISDLKQNTETGFYEITVKLATDYRALGNLYLVDPRHSIEKDSLEANLQQ